MKKHLLVFAVLLLSLITTTFAKKGVNPKIYPQLQAFFNSLDLKTIDSSHYESLVNIKYSVNASNLDYGKWHLVFYCAENSFRSQAAQVFCQTLFSANKYRNIKAHSAGIFTTEINPRLIEYLSKIGYKVLPEKKEGKTMYQVRYSDEADPIILFAKSINDKSIPASNITPIIVCDTSAEKVCTGLKIETIHFALPYKQAKPNDTDQELEAIIKSIATELLFAIKN